MLKLSDLEILLKDNHLTCDLLLELLVLFKNLFPSCILKAIVFLALNIFLYDCLLFFLLLVSFWWRLWAITDRLFSIGYHEVHDVFLRWLCFAIDHYIAIPFLALRVGGFSLSLRRFRSWSLASNTFRVFKITVVTIFCAVISWVGSNYVWSSTHSYDGSLLA